MLKDAAAIVGIGETPFARELEGSEKQLAARAILAALDDAGIHPSEVDGFASYTLESSDEVEIAKNLGAGDVTFFSQVGYGGGAGPATVGHLALAVAAGQCRVGVAWRSRKRGSGGRPWAGSGPAPQFSGVTISDTHIGGTISVSKGGPRGTRFWDVRVTNPDLSTAVLPGALTVVK